MSSERLPESDSEPRFIDCQCPHCGAELSFVDSLAGLAQSCPECVEPLVIPMASTAVAGRLPLPIQLPRLVLRRFHPGDWKDLLEIMSNEEVVRYTDATIMDEAALLHWLESERETRFTRPGQTLCLGLEWTAKSRVIGWASVAYQDETHLQAILSVIVNPAFQRQGLGTEALTGLIRFGFGGIRLHRIIAQCDSRNTAGRRMLEKAGMRGEGEFVQDRQVNGEWVNSVWYGLLRSEYEQWPVA